MIVRVNVVLKRTVVVDSDWRFDWHCEVIVDGGGRLLNGGGRLYKGTSNTQSKVSVRSWGGGRLLDMGCLFESGRHHLWYFSSVFAFCC